MCIIVAKKKNVPMPSEKILKNCFTRNPDGAGIMLAAKGQVYGFKGLMTFEAFESKLKQLTKRFGPLDKLAVVMHFRIGTHGGNIPENTHPFPLSDSYDDLRELEWISSQGMAHNGIIDPCTYHDDIYTEFVSDTMVFIRRIVAPVAKYATITKRRDLLDALELVAGSKLAFLDAKGNLVTAGDFNKKDGVLYSNKSYEKYSYTKAPNLKSFQSYFFDSDREIKSYSSTGHSNYILSNNEQKEIKDITARDYALTYPIEMPFVTEMGLIFSGGDLTDYALDESSGWIYRWDSLNYDWVPTLSDDEYVLFEEGDYESIRS